MKADMAKKNKRRANDLDADAILKGMLLIREFDRHVEKESLKNKNDDLDDVETFLDVMLPTEANQWKAIDSHISDAKSPVGINRGTQMSPQGESKDNQLEAGKGVADTTSVDSYMRTTARRRNPHWKSQPRPKGYNF